MTGPSNLAPPCSVLARDRADPLIATAPFTTRWLLLEQPAAWPAKVLTATTIRPYAAALSRIVTSRRARVLLVRRPVLPLRRPGNTLLREPGLPGREPGRSVGIGASWTVVDAATATETGGTWTPESGLDEAISAFDGDAGFDDPARDRYLVCTHGKHDRCCAERGRPTAAALATRWPMETWECSHLGGDRFSANLIVLPTGTYFGYLDPVAAPGVIAAYRDGEIDAAHFRGVATLTPAAQAALTEALRRLGPANPHRLTVHPVASPPAGRSRWRVDGHPAGDGVLVDVHTVVLPAARRTCLDAVDNVAVTHVATLAGGPTPDV